MVAGRYYNRRQPDRELRPAPQNQYSVAEQLIFAVDSNNPTDVTNEELWAAPNDRVEAARRSFASTNVTSKPSGPQTCVERLIDDRSTSDGFSERRHRPQLL
jgi:hypothetical protein